MNNQSEKLSLKGLKFGAIQVDISNYILKLTLNRPDKKNAINEMMGNELAYCLAFAKQEKSIRVVIIQAKGDVFCSGGDLRTMSGEDEAKSNVPKIGGGTEEISLRIRKLNKPVICKIQGSVYAGALLMVTNSTHAIAVKGATFSAPEIKRGIWPFMVMAGLFRLMPKRQGLDFIMRGRPIDAMAAKEYGLINEVVVSDELDETVAKYANELANLAPSTMQIGLNAYNAQEDMDFEDAIPFLKEELAKCLSSEDAKEGITAFLEKRKPNWK